MLSRTDTISGNITFWEKAYTENFATLCARACRNLTNGNSFEAEDMVSEAFLRVIRYAPDPAPIRNVVSYLWTVVRRVWTAEQISPTNARTDHLEDFSLKELETIASVRVEPEILSVLERNDFLLELKTKLGPISLEENTLIQLRLDGFSLEEIAEALDEDVKRTRFRWYKFIQRQRYRLRKDKERAMARVSNEPAATGTIKA